MAKKKTQKANFLVDLQVYPFQVMFSFNETDNDLIKLLDKYKVDHADSSWRFESDKVHGRTVMFSSNQILVRLPNIPSTSYDFGVLAHEIFHAVEFLFKKINIKHHIKSSESYAYLIGYITEQVYEKLNKHY